MIRLLEHCEGISAKYSFTTRGPQKNYRKKNLFYSKSLVQKRGNAVTMIHDSYKILHKKYNPLATMLVFIILSWFLFTSLQSGRFLMG